MHKKFILISALLVTAIIYYGCKKSESVAPLRTHASLVADFTYVITNQATRTVTFTNTSSNAQNYSWHFGDGQISSALSPQHSYSGNGKYQVILTASGS